MYPVDGIFHPFNNEASEFNLNYDAQTCGKSHSCDFEMLTSQYLVFNFFSLKQGKQYHYSSENLDAESFVNFVEEGYKLAAVTPVPPPIGKL